MIAAVLAKKWELKRPSFGCGTLNILTLISRKRIFLGFSLIVNPELLAARAIANIIDFPNALSVERFFGGRVSLMEFTVKSSSGLCQMPISDFGKNLAMSLYVR